MTKNSLTENREPEAMKIVTVNLQKYQTVILQKLIDVGLIVSRSEGIREAIDLMIRDKLAVLYMQVMVSEKKPSEDAIDVVQPKTGYDMRAKKTYEKIRNMFRGKEDE